MSEIIPLGSVMLLPEDRTRELGAEFETIFRSAWEDGKLDWPGIIRHFAKKYGPQKADAYSMGILVGKQFAKYRTLRYVNEEL